MVRRLLPLAWLCVAAFDCSSGSAPDVSTAPRDAAAVDASVDSSSSCTRIGTSTDAGTMEDASVVHAATPPPPLSGGTLLTTNDTHYAVASDPDRDRIAIVDLTSEQPASYVALSAGDEPGRLVEDAAGRVHVVLRSGGAIATIDPSTASFVQRVPVCPAPRGIAFDASANVLDVACSGGELVTISPDSGEVLRTVRLDPDLRDAVVSGTNLFVSRFRSAEVLVLDHDGRIVSRARPLSLERALAPSSGSGSATFDPDVAWRLVAQPGGGALLLHQRAMSSRVTPPPSGGSYYTTSPFADACAPGLVEGTVTPYSTNGTPSRGITFGSAITLPIDVALSPDGVLVAVVAAGNTGPTSTRVGLYAIGTVATVPCDTGMAGRFLGPLPGRSVAVAFEPTMGPTRVVVQTREPAALTIVDWDSAPSIRTVPIGDDSRLDTGHELFHTPFAGGITCANCHPEGGDDGHVWDFPCDDARRTQPLRGGLLATAPFHWDGHLATFADLADEVFVERLGTQRPTAQQSAALGEWLDALHAIPAAPAVDPTAVARGRALFEDPSVGCTSCHSGPHFTDNATVDVGTGGAFQVPSLVDVALHPPYLHNGCAATLRDRFGPCGGGDRHGHTSQLSDGQLNDLVSYLETL